MYSKYFGLKEKPFSLSADPRFIYYSRSHREALAQMVYAASQDAGFMVLSGEVGTGKTIMINALIDHLPEEYHVAKIYHTALNPEGLVQNICKEFGLDFFKKTLSQLILKIQDFLKWTQKTGDRSILILDEAQNLNSDTLEEVRLLSNFEASHKKILQIILVGQPELEAKLWNINLRQFRERISLRYSLSKLDREETFRYIAHRLKVAGHTNSRVLFTRQAIEKIYELSTGVPRRINIICENALLMSYIENYKEIDEEIIKQVGYYSLGKENTGEIMEQEVKSVPSQYSDARKTQVKSIKKKPEISGPDVVSGQAQAVQDVSVTANPASPSRKKIVPHKSSGNGTFDYKHFHTYMHKFLTNNELCFSKRFRFGRVILGLIFSFIFLILAFIVANIISNQLGIIN